MVTAIFSLLPSWAVTKQLINRKVIEESIPKDLKKPEQNEFPSPASKRLLVLALQDKPLHINLKLFKGTAIRTGRRPQWLIFIKKG